MTTANFHLNEAQQSSLSGLHGIFQGLLAFRIAAGDTVLQQHFANCGKNATVISSTIKNEVIEITGRFIQKSLTTRLNHSKFLSILCDETCDTSKHEQLRICILFVDLNDFVIR